MKRMVTPSVNKRTSAEFHCIKRQRLSWGLPALSESGSFHSAVTLPRCNDLVLVLQIFFLFPHHYCLFKILLMGAHWSSRKAVWKSCSPNDCNFYSRISQKCADSGFWQKHLLWLKMHFMLCKQCNITLAKWLQSPRE